MKHRLSILRPSENTNNNNNVQFFPMNYLKVCRSLRNRLSLKSQPQQQQQSPPSSSVSVRRSHSSSLLSASSAGSGAIMTSSSTTLPSPSPPSLLWGPQGYAQARNEANEVIHRSTNSTNNNTQAAAASAAAASSSLLFVRTVDNRPYFPLLKVDDPTNEESILEIAHVVVSHHRMLLNGTSSSNSTSTSTSKNSTTATTTTIHYDKGTVMPISGGLTNALYKVDLPSTTTSSTTTTSSSSSHHHHENSSSKSYLVRIFGAEGMIDRDEETTHFARLCSASTTTSTATHCQDDDNHQNGSSYYYYYSSSSPSSTSSPSKSIVHHQLDIIGRFANGRVEAWIPNMRPAHVVTDFGNSNNKKGMGLVLELARQFAHLHYGYTYSSGGGSGEATTTAAASATAATTTTDGGAQNHGHGATTAPIATTTSVIERQPQPQPTLWNVINSWIDELSNKLSHEKFYSMNHPSSSSSSSSSQYHYNIMELFGRAVLPPHLQQQQLDASSNNHSIIISYLLEEVSWLKKKVEMEFPNAAVVFCHNDVNAANVLLHTSIDDHVNNINDDNNNNTAAADDAPADDGTTASSIYNKRTVCIIDYEYSSMNYAMYDIANFICEHCGGNDTGIPNYELLPSYERQRLLLREYIRERDKILGKVNNRSYDDDNKKKNDEEEEEEVANLLAQVQVFQMASNLLWGVWGILQASSEVVDGTFRVEEKDLSTWDNLRYGMNRLKRFRCIAKKK